ncbi:beta-1,2-xylosyltransferase XYXT1-like isoform X2 [Musa acuminata AAA Group]|uniref:beta-1,2-xylosyltransferase XYXT1-like isoform X2 n=1 Tax=Musa acuminata AAA Group TaxID=214697 RepID=UPI0031D4784C
MKLAKKFRPQVEPRSFGSGLIVGCFLVSTTYVMISKTMISMEHLSIQYESATRESKPTRSDAIEMHGNASSAESASEVPFEEDNVSSTKNGSDGKEEEEGISRLCESSSGNCKPENDREVLETLTAGDSSESDGAPERKPMCDFSDHRSDVCDMEGDIRVIGKNLSSVMLVTPSDHKGSRDRNESWQIRPYPRKFDDSAMAKVRALNLTSPHGDREAPRCTVNHAVPGVLFSTGGHSGNCFHDFADVLIPLFQTAGPFQGQVQFIIADRQGWWMHKYRPYLMKLSSYDIIDYDNDDRVHCFKHAVVGLRAERDLMIDPAGAPEGYSIMDFVRLTRRAYSLERDRAWAAAGEPPGKKPRLLLIARGGTRRFMNLEEVVGMAEGVGYEVVASEPDFFDVGRFARVVNSCDVMVGVHGAGLTNFVFLPTDAIVIQVVPLGKLDWIATNFYAEPAMGMKLRYLQYDISVEESTLKEAFPRDHQVFKDPESIHKQGWFKLRDIYLKQQNVELDVNRFRLVLQRAFELLREKKYS